MSNNLQVSNRKNQLKSFDSDKIYNALVKAFTANEGIHAKGSERIKNIVSELTAKVTLYFKAKGGVINIEDIQDRVELELMRQEFHKIAKSYVLYREERKKQREINLTNLKVINIDKDGHKEPLNIENFYEEILDACTGLDDVDAKKILEESIKNLFDGAKEKEVYQSAIMTARQMIEFEPSYSYVAARLLLINIKKNVKKHLKLDDISYANYFKAYIEEGLKNDMLSPNLKDFDLDKLSNALDSSKDYNFTYLSLQTLFDRYLIHKDETRYELPQAFFMRVAMGLAHNDNDPTNKAIEFYNLLSSFAFMSSTPTLFNAGTVRPQLSSCFLTTVPDDLKGIYDGIRDNALLSKYAGGIGNDWTRVRSMGSHIKGTNGKSLGVVPFLNVADATAVAVNQGGKRKGAVCAYLETWHYDIEEFLDLRKNTGDDRRRTHDMNTANWVPDLFMKRVKEGGSWTLFSPEEVPELHDLYGQEFEDKYAEYELKARNKEMKLTKTIDALSLWRKMLSAIFETGHPWVTFKDPCNMRSPQQHVGVIHSSNLCTEITLNTSDDEVAVCNLGSINLPHHIKDGKLNEELLEQTINTAIRMLDNVIDRNYYTIPQAKNSNAKHRPIGLGIMGFQDALYALKIDYESDEAVRFADNSMEIISYYAIKASCKLAKEKGSYETFDGSLWSKGIMPHDTIEGLKKYRKQYLIQDTTVTLKEKWASLREDIKKYGMRNSNVLAIAPTATISNICGVSQSIEPTYQNLFVKSNMSGEFTIVNPYLAKELKALNLWDNVMVNDIKYYNGSIADIQRIPQDIRNRFKTAFEIDPHWLVKCGSRRAKWMDQAQSLNLYVKNPSGKIINDLYMDAWLHGLKTTYYCRTLGATSTEKATIHDGALNAVQNTSSKAQPKACAIDDEECEACQ